MKKQRLNLTEKLVSSSRSKSARKALASFKSYKKTMGILDKVNIALGKNPIYNTTSNSTFNIKIVSNDLSSSATI